MVVVAASWAHSATVSDLESARRSLSAARDAVSTASVELRTLLADGGLTKSGIEDYRSYLARLQQSVVSNCRTLLELKHDMGDSGPEPGCDPGRMAPAGPVSFPQERTEAEKTASLDGQLGASLSEFDELLLREMEDLKRKQSGSPDTAAGSGSGEGESQSESQSESQGENQSENQGEGSSTASGGAESGDSGLSGTGAQQQGAEQQGEEQQQGGEVAARSEQNSQQQGAGNAGSREGKDDATGTGRRDQPPATDDDDIVARQLREAAENESDPELREKLWQEYRRYKANQTTQSKN